MLTFSRYLCSFGFFEKRYFIWILFCFRFLFSFSLAFTFLRCCLLRNCCCCLLRYAHTQNMYTHTTAHKLDFIATLHLISLWYTYDTYFFTCFYFNSVFGFYVLVKNRHRQMDPFPGKSALWITYFFPLFHSTKVVHPMRYKMWMNNSDYVGDCNQNHQQHYHRRLFVENEKSPMNAFRFHFISFHFMRKWMWMESPCCSWFWWLFSHAFRVDCIFSTTHLHKMCLHWMGNGDQSLNEPYLHVFRLHTLRAQRKTNTELPNTQIAFSRHLLSSMSIANHFAFFFTFSFHFLILLFPIQIMEFVW